MAGDVLNLDDIRARCEETLTGHWLTAIPASVQLAKEDVPALLAEVERLREAQRWIPVSERYPPPCQYVHVSFGGVGESIATAGVDKKSWMSRDGVFHAWKAVTHWKPLSALPEETAPDGIGREEG